LISKYLRTMAKGILVTIVGIPTLKKDNRGDTRRYK